MKINFNKEELLIAIEKNKTIENPSTIEVEVKIAIGNGKGKYYRLDDLEKLGIINCYLDFDINDVKEEVYGSLASAKYELENEIKARESNGQ